VTALLTASAALVTPALADGAPGDELREVIVTATRTPVAADQLAVSVTVIDRQEIDRSLATDVGDLLRLHAGMEVARNGGPGQLESLFVRGANSNHVSVLIDGVRMNPGTIGGAALQNISPDDIERIEIVKGPRSALYGTDAIGGVINIFTRAGANDPGTLSVAGGRYGTYGAHANGGVTVGDRGRVGFAAGYDKSDGFPTQVGDNVDRGYDNTTLNLFGEYAATDALTLRARAWRAAGTSEYSTTVFDPVTFASSLAPVDQDFENSAYAADVLFKPTDALRLRASLSHVVDDIDQNQILPGYLARDYAHTKRNMLELQSDFSLAANNELTAGAQLTRENTRSLSFGTQFDVNTDVNQFFLQDRHTFDRQDLLAAVGYTDHDTFGHKVTWNGEYGLTLPSRTRFTVSAGTAFHAPTSTDRFGFGGNPALKPEVSKQFEVGIRQPFGSGHSVYVTAFRNDVTDLITFVLVDPVTFEFRGENVARARIKGVETGYEFHNDAWRLRAEATFQDPRDRDTDQRLLRRARENYVLAVERHLRRFDVGVNALYAGNRYDSAFPGNIRLKGYTLVNFTARYAVTERWSLQASLENAFDERYTLLQGYNTAGRSLYAAVRYSAK